MNAPSRILVIKLSALGDMILAMAAFERIRAAHPGALITLLTTPPYEGLARACGYFDAVEIDGRPRGVVGFLSLVRRLRGARYDLVYDLQTNDRTNLLFQALRPSPPAWSGTAFGSSLPARDPQRMRRHTLERQARQLQAAGAWPDAPTTDGVAPPPDLRWLIGEPPLRQNPPLALLAPGASPKRPAKLWPVEFYGELAARLIAGGFAAAVVGGEAERPLARIVAAAAPEIQDLTGATDFAALARLASSASLAIGNDTGPMHIIAGAGTPSVVLFSSDSDPALCAPRGRVRVLRRASLASLPVETVHAEAMSLISSREAARP